MYLILQITDGTDMEETMRGIEQNLEIEEQSVQGRKCEANEQDRDPCMKTVQEGKVSPSGSMSKYHLI